MGDTWHTGWSGDQIVFRPRSGQKHFHSLVLQARARPELMWMALPRLPYTPSRCKLQPRRSTLSKLFRNVPILTSLEVSPFFDFVLVVCCFVGLARSVALRSPKGGALRAKRKARPTTVASPPRAASRRAAPPSGGRLPATDDWPVAPTCACLSAHAARGFAAPPGRSWLARGFPASVAHDRDTRWRCGRAALRTPTLCCALARSCDFAARVGKTGSRSAPPSLR